MPSLESGYHKWVCIDHSHPHIFKDGRCLNCGKLDIPEGFVEFHIKILEALEYRRKNIDLRKLLPMKHINKTTLNTED